MATSEGTAAVVPSRPAWAKLAFCSVLTVVAFACIWLFGETATRAMGRRPWDPEADNRRMVVEPGGKLMQPDDDLGYVLVPGRFAVHLGDFTFNATNVDEHHRATRPLEADLPADAPGVWFFGDSFAYGWAVEDEDVFAWKVQAAHPNLDVRNMSVGGYSTLQAMLAYEKAIAEGAKPPRIIGVTYASLHDGRNAMLRGNRKVWNNSLMKSPRFPVAWMRGDQVEYDRISIDYRPWPFQTHSAFVNLLEDNYNRSQVVTTHAERVSRALLQRFHEVAEKHGSEMVVLGIYPNARTLEMLQWCESHGIRALDISVDYSVPANITKVDAHPSGAAHSAFAEKIEQILPR